MRSGLLLTAAAAAAINNGCDDRLRPGCGRVAIALVGGFSDITRGGHHARFEHGHDHHGHSHDDCCHGGKCSKGKVAPSDEKTALRDDESITEEEHSHGHEHGHDHV